MSWKVKQLTGKDHILSYLETDRLYAAYAIGDLEPELFDQSTWFGAETKGQLHAVTMHFRGVKMPVLFLMGETEGVRIILEEALHPERVNINCRAEHLPMTRDIYLWDEPIAMLRMALKTEALQPVISNCIRLNPDHADLLRKLYEHGGGDGFSAGQIEHGVFYGVFNNSQLLAVAGTHLVSRAYNVAAVGNVFTHPSHRGHGYGTAATNAVLAELIGRGGIHDIVLNVRQNNTSAVHIYKKLGFECCCNFFEGCGSLRKFGIT
jgi:RimJ/RimL family protein N-acetyltransferase